MIENSHSRNHTLHDGGRYKRRLITSQKVKNFVKSANSHSHTKNHTKEKQSGTEVIRGNIMEFCDRIVLNKKRVGKTPIGFWKLGNSVNGQLLAYSGKQGSTEIIALCTIQQCLGSNGVAASAFQSETAYFDGNPYMSTTNAAGFGTGTVTRPKDDEIVLRASQTKIVFSSGSIGATHMDLYVLVCKQPTSLTPTTLWNQSYIDTATGQGVGILPVGAAAGAGGYPTKDFLFQTPRDAKTFKKFWKIIEHRAIKMEQSSSVEWNLNILHNKILKRDRISGYTLSALNTFAGTNAYQPGTVIVMGVVRGLNVVRDSVAGSVSQYTTATSAIDYVGRTDVMLHGVPEAMNRLDTRRVNQYIDTLASNAAQTSFFDQVNTAAEVPISNAGVF